MTDKSFNYISDLHSIKNAGSHLQNAASIIEMVPAIGEELADPTVPDTKKHMIVDKIFPREIRDFIKLLCDNSDFDSFGEIVADYKAFLENQGENIEYATLRYVTAPTDEQLAGIRKFLAKEYGSEDILIKKEEDPSLKSGFVLTVGSREYDWSEQSRIEQLSQRINEAVQKSTVDENILSILRSSIDDFEVKDKEVGIVKWVGDGIVNVNGIDHAFYGEIVIFDCGVKGMVQDIRRDEIGIILFDRDVDIKEGSKVVRTGKMAGIPVGEGFLGRIVDALGTPIDGKGEIDADGFRPVECPAPSIVDRKSVSQPMETGLLSIDSMFPIGRGQRELIIGDRQTGKTSIATDTIINQKGKDVVCVYVAIGQKASTIAKLVNTLKEHGAMDYTIIVSATAADPAPLQYIAPYAGTALAEYFMYSGKDVLIVYDDLSKHAVAYRAISLLLERSPGREAYPGDVFYLHSRLLERSARIIPEAGGGSITALPIIETQAGDLSAYIPTNVISITDGQIFLESQLFNAGQRPAVNVGLSVSRVGGAAQTKAMKKAAGSIRIDLAQYREMEVFTQFSSDLDDATKRQLAHGRALMELLKQPLNRPFSMAEQVIILVAANAHIFSDLDVMKIKKFRLDMLAFFHEEHSDIINQLNQTKNMTDELKESIIEAATEFKNNQE
ncbi:MULTISPECIES: F0F1 ATP synthase subunit alpha [Pseudobutyrivibrio]|uniref:Multifunctional fusion protein n=1 Tax=Pseudobutyrivibrio xylanivorans TaxID=185007 RepID=A0A1G5RRL1_PSEXY|nr:MULTISPECIES: F0F1 ATP synthase subunit alpha [Pseudobutyrivibrio]MDC7279786.1 F0F1 ATP synthase subunit alpha [Butyrivibrio fibrisolvens]SCZ76702.1 F-type H+-transporting ATPase subunit alpha [Pseudobutyrivibrio xylanivorans]